MPTENRAKRWDWRRKAPRGWWASKPYVQLHVLNVANLAIGVTVWLTTGFWLYVAVVAAIYSFTFAGLAVLWITRRLWR